MSIEFLSCDLKRLRLECMDKRTISEVMREMGRKGGKIGGKRSLETMTPEQRAERARNAAAARETKRAERGAKATVRKGKLKRNKGNRRI